MATGILGKKLGMTRIFTQDGQWIDVTLVQAGPCVVIQRKTEKKDGYEAVQVGFDEIKPKRCTKPLKGHFEKAGVPPKRFLKEFRVEVDNPLKPGDEIKLDIFKVGDRVDISGKSKGKGFAGVVKRHGYSGGPGTHGSNFHRRPGSIGQSAYPAEVYKGKGLPGHMGNVRVTVQNLEVVDIVPEKNLIVIRGSIPGSNGGLVEIKHTVKIKRNG